MTEPQPTLQELDQAVIDAGRKLTEAHLDHADDDTLTRLRLNLQAAMLARWPQ